MDEKPIKDGPESHFGGRDGQSELEKYVKSNFAEIFEKINELNKMATHLVKQHEKYVKTLFFSLVLNPEKFIEHPGFRDFHQG